MLISLTLPLNECRTTISKALSTAHSTSLRHSALLTPHQRGTQHCSLHINEALSTAHSTSTRHSALLTPHQRGTQHCSLHINEALSTAHSTSTRHSALLTPHQRGTQHCSLHINEALSTAHFTAFHIQDNSYLLCSAAIIVQKLTLTPTCHTDYRFGISHALHSLCIHDRPCISVILSSNLSCSHTHLRAHQHALHTQYYPFHSTHDKMA